MSNRFDELGLGIVEMVAFFAWLVFLALAFSDKDAWIPFAILTSGIIIYDALITIARTLKEKL